MLLCHVDQFPLMEELAATDVKTDVLTKHQKKWMAKKMRPLVDVFKRA
jgi:hypothetical protein